jgi:hypothetical protein
VLSGKSISSALGRLKSANDLCTSEWRSCRGIVWVASHEQTLLPFSTLQPHALPSADIKVTRAASNKVRLVMRHDVVWCRTMLGFALVHARTLLPAALASVPFGCVLVRVRVRARSPKYMN